MIIQVNKSVINFDNVSTMIQDGICIAIGIHGKDREAYVNFKDKETAEKEYQSLINAIVSGAKIHKIGNVINH